MTSGRTSGPQETIHDAMHPGGSRAGASRGSVPPPRGGAADQAGGPARAGREDGRRPEPRRRGAGPEPGAGERQDVLRGGAPRERPVEGRADRHGGDCGRGRGAGEPCGPAAGGAHRAGDWSRQGEDPSGRVAEQAGETGRLRGAHSDRKEALRGPGGAGREAPCAPGVAAGSIMTERQYSDEEAAAIFERASETEHAVVPVPAEGRGLTLAALQDIGREVGISPESIALAAQSLDLAGRPALQRFMGLPIGVGRIVEFDRRLSDSDWEVLVADLRTTFQARGTVRYDGPFRQWTNGNLQALLEPTPTGDRLRLQTVQGA